VQRTSSRRPAHHKLPQGEADRIVARVLGRIQVNGITEAKAIRSNEAVIAVASHHKWSIPMWVLMYVFSYSISPAATNDKAEWRLLPTVVFQEFSNEERCRAAKSTLEGSLKEAGAKLKSGLEDLKSIGKADPAQIILAFNVECLPK